MVGNRRFTVAMAVLCLAATTQPRAESDGAKMAAERFFAERWADHLPIWCLYTQAFPDGSLSPYYGDPRGEEFRKLYGGVFSAMHHYCFGLARAHEASLAEDMATRNFKFQDAAREYDYVLNRAPDDFILKPELLVQKGAALEAVEDYIRAVASYTDAISLNSEYEPAYIGLSSCFEGLGDLRKSVAMIDAGLQQVPGSEMLLARRAKLLSLGAADPNPR